MESFGPSPARIYRIEMCSASEITRLQLRSRGRALQRARHMKFIWLLGHRESNVGSCREAQKVTTKDVLVSKIANDLTTTTIHRRKQATQIAKAWALKNKICGDVVGVWRFTCYFHQAGKWYLSHETILPRKHCCKQVAATNFQPPRDRRHLSYCHCENLQGMPSAEFLAHGHHSGANIALWPRSPPSLQWQVHGSTSESWVTKYGTHWHSATVFKLSANWQWWDPGIKYDWIHLQTIPNPSTSSLFVAYQCINMYQPHQPRHVILDSHSSPKESRLTIVSWQLSRPNSFTSPSQAIWNTRNMGEIMKVFKRRGWLCASFIS